MFENIMNFLKKFTKKQEVSSSSKDTAKERLHLVLMQDRANVSADFLDLMKQEIIEVIKKYIEIDENAIDVRLTNKENEDGTNGAPALYANIPIVNIKEEAKNELKEVKEAKKEAEQKEKKEQKKESNNENNNNSKETKEEKTKEVDKNQEPVEQEKVNKDKQKDKTENQPKKQNEDVKKEKTKKENE